MIFCGQCGLQLSPGSTRCPRCGAMIEGTSTGAVDDMHPDDATTASPAFIPPNQPGGTLLPNGQQPLVLRSGMDNGNYNYGTGTPETYDATSRVEAPNFNTRMPSNQNMQTAYPGQGYNQGGLYPTQAAYPEYGTQNAGSYPGQGGSYPGQGINSQLGGAYASHPSQFPPQQSLQAANHTKGRVAAMVIILIGLLMVLTAVILFAWQSTSSANSPTNSANGVALLNIQRTATTLQLPD